MPQCDLLVRGQYILTLSEKQTIVKNGFVAIGAGKILAIGPDKERKNWPAKQTIGSPQALVMPGLVNTHTHSAMVRWRGLADDLPLAKWLEDYIWPAEKQEVNPRFIKKFGRLACLEMIKAGITCFADMYFFPAALAAVAQEAGLRAVLAEGILDFPTPSFKTPAQALAASLGLAKEFAGQPLIKIALGPHSAYTCSVPLLEKVAQAAKENNLLVHIHISETKKEVRQIKEKYGLTPPALLAKLGLLGPRTIAAHSVWLEKDDLKLFQQYQAKISHNPSSNLKLASGIMPLAKVLKAGLTVGLGTDGAASNNALNLFNEMRLAALLPKGVALDPCLAPAVKVVEMATRGGAQVLGWDNEIGRLVPGFSADLITINLAKPHLSPIYNPFSHLVYAVQASDVEDVVVAGRLIMRRRQVLTLDEEKIIAEAKI